MNKDWKSKHWRVIEVDPIGEFYARPLSFKEVRTLNKVRFKDPKSPTDQELTKFFQMMTEGGFDTLRAATRDIKDDGSRSDTPIFSEEDRGEMDEYWGVFQDVSTALARLSGKGEDSVPKD